MNIDLAYRLGQLCARAGLLSVPVPLAGLPAWLEEQAAMVRASARAAAILRPRCVDDAVMRYSFDTHVSWERGLLLVREG